MNRSMRKSRGKILSRDQIEKMRMRIDKKGRFIFGINRNIPIWKTDSPLTTRLLELKIRLMTYKIGDIAYISVMPEIWGVTNYGPVRVSYNTLGMKVYDRRWDWPKEIRTTPKS